jgi:hypothetical protein
MKLDQILSRHEARKKRPAATHRLRTRAYQEHYPVVKEAVLKGVPLRSVVTILKEAGGAFPERTVAAVWQAYRRALKHEGITLSEEKTKTEN